MRKIVAILGAGASKEGGAPLMAEFLDVAADLLWSQAVENTGDFQMVFEAIGQLQRVHSKAQLDITNVESVFAAFEMARTLGGFADYDAAQSEALAAALRAVIVTTIEEKLTFPITKGAIKPPTPYEPFAELCRDLNREVPGSTVSVMTFNYDLGVDYAFNVVGLPIEYGIEDRPQVGAIPLLKLHGSLNWRRCGCSQLFAWPIEDIAKTQLVVNESACRFKTAQPRSPLRHCGQPVPDEPVIVPPTWNKAHHHQSLSAVWSRAARELREAESLLVFGFSLPATDAFFSALYALGTVGESPLRRFWVFNPEPRGRGVETRFRSLLGPGAAQRFEYFEETFREAIRTVRQEYRLKGLPRS